MQGIIDWIKAHRGVSALAAFLLFWAIVSGSTYFMSGSARTSVSQSAVGGGMGTADFSLGAPAYDMADDAVMEERGATKAVSIAPSPFPPYQPSAGETAAEVEARIIKTGTMAVVVESAPDAVADLTTYASSLGGFVEHSAVNESRTGVRSGSVTMRVPVASFEASLAYVRDLADFVRSEAVDGQDVTEQYTDLVARLGNAREQEKAYLAVLDRANTVEDILKVQRELGNIRAEIESYEGRLKYLENRTSYSTVHVQLEEEATVQIPTGTFRPWTAVKQAASALINAFQQVAISLIWTVILGLGLVVPAGLVIWLIWHLARRYWLKQ